MLDVNVDVGFIGLVISLLLLDSMIFVLLQVMIKV